MSVLISSDWHVSSNLKDRYRHDWVAKQLPKMIERHRVSRLIMLGDITHAKDNHNAELVNEIVGYLHKLTQQCPILINRGNHDGVLAQHTFFEFTKHLPRITWITNPSIINVPELGDCFFLPHTRNHTKDWEGFNFKDMLVLAHNTFQGADAGHGHKLRGIPTSIFPKRTQVISGDIHVPQQLGPVTYVGAPYTVAFGDEYKPRVILLDKLENDKIDVRSIPCLGPQKFIVKILKPEVLPELNLAEGDMVQARVKLTSSDYARWPEIKQKVREHIEASGAIVFGIEPIKASASIKLARKRTSNTHDDRTVLNQYAKRYGIAPDTLKTGFNLLEKA